jgi:hypothetical protein
MVKYVLAIFMVLNGLSSAFAAEVGVPIHVQSLDGKQAAAGVISAEPTRQNPNALEILRAELIRQEEASQKRAAKDGVFISTTKRFAPESITFFIAMGAVTFNSMWIKAHGDPLALERQIMSLKDPIAHLSFYSFMQTQGYYMNFHTSRERFTSLDASTRTQVMRRLSYEGMAVGSLASSIVADLGYSAKMCVDKWIKGKTDNQSLESCKQAWAQWTVRNKFTQYFPQIISMWASQMATELIERRAAWGFSKITATAWMQKLLTREAITSLAYKVTAADVVTVFVGGGWVTKSIKLVGKVTRFAGFLAVDHILSNYTYRPINNIIQPTLFEADAIKLGYYWHQADAGNWDGSKVNNITSFEKEIENYGRRMQQWRDHLNMDAETDLNGWLEMTKQILSQVEYSYNFYRNFIGEWNSTINTFYLIEQKKLAASAGLAISRYPIRSLPLFGVNIGKCQTAGPLQDYYFLRPDDVERCQREHIASIVPKFLKPRRALKPNDLKTYNGMIASLKSNDPNKMGATLKEMNMEIDIYQMQMSSEAAHSEYSGDFIQSITAVRDAIGKPEPQLEPMSGFTKAFAVQTSNEALEEQADYRKWSVPRFMFSKTSDLMFYKMICGSPQGKLEKTRIGRVNILAPQFSPPSFLKPNADRAKFCSSQDNRMFEEKIAGLPLKNYIAHNMNLAAFGDFRGPNPASPLYFEKWWLQNAKTPIASEFAYYDQQYRQVVKKAYDNYFNNRGWFKYVADSLNQSLYLPKSTENALNAEANLYLQILNRAMMASAPVPDGNTKMPGDSGGWASWIGDKLNNLSLSGLVKDAVLYFDYTEFATKSSAEAGFPSIYGRSTQEVAYLNKLLKDYSNFFRNANFKFDDYIAHSKRVDNTIHLILVKAGLEKEAGVPAEAIEDFSQPATSGTENTPKGYEPVPVANPSYKQRMTIAAIKGIRQVESQIRRYIRMRIALKNLLQVTDKEVLNEWNQTTNNQVNPASANPWGGR